MSKRYKRYVPAAIIVIAIGVLSRVVQTGNILFDSYLGDALYAALLYLILRIGWPQRAARDHANWAMVLVFAIELFQLTGIPLALRQSDNALLVALSIALGTTFGLNDVVAYGVGILAIFCWDVTMGVGPHSGD
mgnify:CR=1 FL=1